MEWLSTPWPVTASIAAFVLAGATITYFGLRLTVVVDVLADRTRMGEAFAGAILLAGATSMAGLVVSVVAAADGNASLAVSNSVGGIAAQTAFIVVADLTYRRANIEHAVASLANIFLTFLLVGLLGVVLMGVMAPDWAILQVHPATVVLAGVYFYGMHLARQVGDNPMWTPRRTAETLIDVPDAASMRQALVPLFVRFFAFGAVVAGSGFVVAQAGLSLIETTGVGGTFVGAFFTGVITSAPELVTSVAAVRAGALTLAVAAIVGGNSFDVLFIAISDGVYREGPIYQAIGQGDIFVLAWTMSLAAILGAGLVRRQRHGIGFEGVAILTLYAAGAVVVSFIG